MKEVPKHNSGSQSNTESSTDFDDEQQAKKHFDAVKKRLLDVNHWHSYAGAASADFCVTDANGNPINSVPEKGNYFRINIPGPGSASGEGYDWVRVEDISGESNNSEECFSITVRPAPSPVNEQKDVAHFFTEEATSSFVVKREKNNIIAGVYGRNEKPNTDTERVSDKIRNAAVATGAISAFSKLQWKSLVNGLIKKD